MENFKQRPRKQPLLFTSEEDDAFNLEDFITSLLVKSDLFDTQPKPVLKRKTRDEKEEKEQEKEQEKEKEKEEEKLLKFLVKKLGKIIIQAADCGYHSIHVNNESHILYNRVAFYTYMKQLLGEYAAKLEEQQNLHSCKAIKQQKNNISLLAHQEIVRRYMNVHTPYRGLLLYHGLGSGKTCSSIAIAENMKQYKKIVVMCPASLKTNYMKELKKCGEPLYNASIHHWRQIQYQSSEYPGAIKQMCIQLKRNEPVWITVPDEPANFTNLTSADQQQIQLQIDQLILTKYDFVHYNGLSETARVWKQMLQTEKTEGNPFHNKVVIVDEAHNLISRIVNKIGSKSEKIAVKLYNYFVIRYSHHQFAL